MKLRILIRMVSLLPQAIQHIEGTQERMVVPEEEKRRAVIVTPGRVLADSDTASDNEGSEDC